MKFSDVLRGHVPHTDNELRRIWGEAHFCLDTNVLLDVYRYSDQNREAFFGILGAVKERLFVPHRIAVEFARNRAVVIRGHFAPHRLIKSKLDEAAKKIEEYGKHPHREDLKTLIQSMRKMVDDKFHEAEKTQLSLLSDDHILRRLKDLVGDEVGEPFAEVDIEKEYKRRKEGMIPPYCKVDDKDKDEEGRIGDVVIWLELLAEFGTSNKPLVFVTDDMKENWWQDAPGGTRVPQPRLIQEMFGRSKNETLFYTSERFSEVAPGLLGVKAEGLAEETKLIREQERKAIHSASRRERSFVSHHSANRAMSANEALWFNRDPAALHSLDNALDTGHRVRVERGPEGRYWLALGDGVSRYMSEREADDSRSSFGKSFKVAFDEAWRTARDKDRDGSPTGADEPEPPPK